MKGVTFDSIVIDMSNKVAQSRAWLFFYRRLGVVIVQ